MCEEEFGGSRPTEFRGPAIHAVWQGKVSDVMDRLAIRLTGPRLTAASLWGVLGCLLGCGGDPVPAAGAEGPERTAGEMEIEDPGISEPRADSSNSGQISDVGFAEPSSSSRRWLTRRELALTGKPVGVGEVLGPAGDRFLAVLLEDPGRIELRSVRGDLTRLAQIDCGAWPIGPVALGPGRFAVASQAEGTIETYAITANALVRTSRVSLGEAPAALVRSADRAKLHAVSLHGNLFTHSSDRTLSSFPVGCERATALLAVPAGLWVASQVPPAVMFLPGGQIENALQIPLEGIPRALLALDLDPPESGNGIRELVVAGGDEDLWIVELDPGGAPLGEAPQPLRLEAPGHVPTRLTSADLDADGRPELIGLHRHDTSYGVLGRFDRGSAAFAFTTSEYAGQSPTAVACTDVDGDGRPDLIVAGRDALALSVLSGTGIARSGKPPFYDAFRVPFGTNPLYVAGWHTSATAKPSVVALLSAEASIRIARNDGNGYLVPAEKIEVGPSPRRALAFAPNSVGAEALAVLCEPTDGSRLVLLLPTAEGGLAVIGEPIPIGRAQGLALDSAAAAPALLASDPSRAALWRVRPVAGAAPEIDELPLPAPASAIATHADSGCFALGLLGVQSKLALGRGPIEGEPITVAEVSGQVLDLAFGDADGRGLPDVFALVSRSADHKQAVVELWLGNEDGWKFATRSQAGLKPIQLTAGDLDADGRDDALIAAQNDHQVQVLLTRENGTRLEPSADLGAGLGCFSVALVDLSGNGIRDVVVANAFSADVSVIYGLE